MKEIFSLEDFNIKRFVLLTIILIFMVYLSNLMCPYNTLDDVYNSRDKYIGKNVYLFTRPKNIKNNTFIIGNDLLVKGSIPKTAEGVQSEFIIKVVSNTELTLQNIRVAYFRRTKIYVSIIAFFIAIFLIIHYSKQYIKRPKDA